MKRFMTYATNHKGVTLVMMALMLALLIIFASLAIDISYMYFTKNQLQVAADSSSLAGAPLLEVVWDTDSSSFSQMPAREKAWEFACKNKAAGGSVFLVTSSTDCASPPSSLNDTQNLPDGDIVVGHWDKTQFECLSPTGTTTVNFCPATGSTQLLINAIKTVGDRTGKPGGMPETKLFLGKVFGWNTMPARADAIAQVDAEMGPFPLCEMNCGVLTPLTVVGQNVTPGTRVHIKAASGQPFTAWTTLTENNTNTNDVVDIILGIIPTPPVCQYCLWTTNGTLNPAYCAIRQRIIDSGKDYIVNGVTIHGWKVTIPILQDTPSSCNDVGCIDGDPTSQPPPFYVRDFADVIVTHAMAEGKGVCKDSLPNVDGPEGIVMVGTGPGPSGFSSITCRDCTTGIQPSPHAKLVK